MSMLSSSLSAAAGWWGAEWAIPFGVFCGLVFGVINGLGSIGPVVQEEAIGYIKGAYGVEAMLILLVAGFLAPVPILMLHIVEAAVQAYIFGMLALIYVAGGIQSQQLREASKE